jgi:enoyl-CoA hydratase
MSKDLVTVQIEDSIAFLTFNGQGDLNLLDLNLILEMRSAIEVLEGDSQARVLVIRGHGEKAFSGGVDVRKMKEFSPIEAETFIRSLHSLMRKIMTLKKPVIASILGPCLGGAMELVMACDLRIAADDSLFGLPEIRVGVPSVIEASLLSKFIGLGKARELILTGDIIDVDQADRLGLVNRVVPRDSLVKETRDMAARLLGLSPMIISVQKDIMDKWLNLSEEQGAEYSAKAFALCFATSHPREAMEAFLEKREPRYEPLED